MLRSVPWVTPRQTNGGHRPDRAGAGVGQQPGRQPGLVLRPQPEQQHVHPAISLYRFANCDSATAASRLKLTVTHTLQIQATIPAV